MFELITKSLFFYPEAINWMWDYCLPLGKFTHEGKNYDLGVFVERDTVSAAIVFDNEPGSYLSGYLPRFAQESHNPVYTETLRIFNIFKGE